jgi:integrase/recombinase XerC
MLSKYLDTLQKQGYSTHSLRAYTREIERYLHFLGKDAAAATHKDARRYVIYLKKSGLQNRSVKRALSSVRGYYSYLERHNCLDSGNPFHYLPPMRTELRLPSYLFYNELERMMAACSDTALGIRDRALMEMLYSTGLRASELTALNTDAFSRSRCALIRGKGGRERYVFLTAKAQEALAAYRACRAALLAAGGSKAEPTEALFLNHRGGRLSERGLYKAVKRYEHCLSYGKTIGVHIFRHTFATHMLNENADLRYVQEFLGHASLSTTQIYTHVGIERLKNVYRQAHPHAGRHKKSTGD